MTNLNALADRVEESRGGDRELDHEIYMAADVEHGSFDKLYTASLDAAMSLMPPDWDHMEVYRPDHQTLGWTVHILYNANLRRASWEGFGQTHALALLAACLRARATGGSHE